MGYNLYITRAKDWADESGPRITREEWLEYVASDSELKLDESLGKDMAIWSGLSKHEFPWIQWSDGLLQSKYPDPPLIEKMVSIAVALGAHVQGEEGEEYGARGVVRRPKPQGLLLRTWRSLRDTLTPEPPPVDPASLPFRVGDRVKDVWGRQAVITKMDLKADHGMGHIEVRYDNGHVICHAAIAHGFEPVRKE